MEQQQKEAPDLSTLDAMPHLTQSVEDAKKAIQKKVAAVEKESDEDDPKTKEEYVFDFSYTDGRGKVWSGKFKNKIITLMDRQGIGNLQTQWQGGYPYSSCDPEIAGLNYILAHMAVSLQPVRGGEWAKSDAIRKLTDLGLVQKLYEEVSAHEAKFHRPGENQKAGKEGS